MKFRFSISILLIILASLIGDPFTFAQSKCSSRAFTYGQNLKSMQAAIKVIQEQASITIAEIKKDKKFETFKNFDGATDAIKSNVDKLVQRRDSVLQLLGDFGKECACQRVDQTGKSYGSTTSTIFDDTCIRDWCDSKNGKPAKGDKCLLGSDIIFKY